MCVWEKCHPQKWMELCSRISNVISWIMIRMHVVFCLLKRIHSFTLNVLHASAREREGVSFLFFAIWHNMIWYDVCSNFNVIWNCMRCTEAFMHILFDVHFLPVSLRVWCYSAYLNYISAWCTAMALCVQINCSLEKVEPKRDEQNKTKNHVFAIYCNFVLQKSKSFYLNTG